MRCNYSQVMLVACLSLVIGACSNSDGIAPLPTGGTSGGMSGGLNDGTNSVSAGTLEIGPADDGIAGDNAVTVGAGGDTGGALVAGVGTTGGASDIVGAVAVPEMQGEWVTGCLQRGMQFQTQSVSVVGARMLSEIAVFSDQNCSIPASLSAELDGTTIQRNATTVPTGNTRPVSLGDAIEVNFYFEQGTVDNKPLTSTDFQSDDLIEKIEFGIVLIHNDALYFGDSNLSGYAGNSAESRPISLNTLAVFSRTP